MYDIDWLGMVILTFCLAYVTKMLYLQPFSLLCIVGWIKKTHTTDKKTLACSWSPLQLTWWAQGYIVHSLGPVNSHFISTFQVTTILQGHLDELVEPCPFLCMCFLPIITYPTAEGIHRSQSVLLQERSPAGGCQSCVLDIGVVKGKGWAADCQTGHAVPVVC